VIEPLSDLAIERFGDLAILEGRVAQENVILSGDRW
jgi:hypothetical protein